MLLEGDHIQKQPSDGAVHLPQLHHMLHQLSHVPLQHLSRLNGQAPVAEPKLLPGLGYGRIPNMAASVIVPSCHKTPLLQQVLQQLLVLLLHNLLHMLLMYSLLHWLLLHRVAALLLLVRLAMLLLLPPVTFLHTVLPRLLAPVCFTVHHLGW
jgi:hypothetical protein